MQKPKLVGVLNVTPDSFSDGGQFFTTEKAIEHATQLVNDGVSVIDIGAESTRPGATPLTPEQEWFRLESILEALTEQFHDKHIQLSLDTRHPKNAEKAIQLGVDWINDVSGADSKSMQQLVAVHPSCKIVAMHHLGIPADKQKIIPLNEDATQVVKQWCVEKIQTLESAGIPKNRIIIDPGLGFGKNAQQSLKLLQDIHAFTGLGVELFVGHSRKSFLQPFYGDDMQQRDLGTLVASLYMAEKNVDYVRVHNVAMHKSAFSLHGALREGK